MNWWKANFWKAYWWADNWFNADGSGGGPAAPADSDYIIRIRRRRR